MRDYFFHARHSAQFKAEVYLPRDVVWDESNPWWHDQTLINPEHHPETANVLFISGLGWERFIPEGYKQNSPVPIFYLVQGLFKLNPAFPHYQHFAYKAIRICVSQVITDELENRKVNVNGPVFTIPNGIATETLPQALPLSHKDIDLLIVGLKNPDLAITLKQRLNATCYRDKNLVVLTTRLAQAEFTELINKARCTVFLPALEEGFYLPALEGMALETLVICPDVGGNRQFCHADINCFLPRYTSEEIYKSMLQTLTLTENKRNLMIMQAKKTVQQHSLLKERQAFLEILHNVKNIW